MIEFIFSVRPDQGDPTGFDLGDMLCVGDSGEETSSGKSPDQGMMIYISVAQLLAELSSFFEAPGVKALRYTGVDTSFGLTFRRKARKSISVAGAGGIFTEADEVDLAESALRAAEEFSAAHVSQLPANDAAYQDYQAALAQFRRIVSQRTRN
ncbi:hypothetical protein AB0I22_02920 [Streptomyces sp. NPDC050610]|uniref:hypothetical protein n=1 Tax=Streptomyces sp. NPDC050610 TaxID=3157097 RepID=UPI003443B55D